MDGPTVSFLLVTLVFVARLAMLPKPLPTAEALEVMPWWAPTGGIVGSVAVSPDPPFSSGVLHFSRQAQLDNERRRNIVVG